MSSANDEVNLVELYRSLWRQRILIILIVGSIVCVGIAYILFSTKIYEAEYVVQPPFQGDIASLNYGRGGDSGLSMITVDQVYDVYVKKLKSDNLRRDAFEKIFKKSSADKKELIPANAQYSNFINSIQVKFMGQDQGGRYKILARTASPDDSVRLVNLLAAMSAEKAKKELLDGVYSDVKIKADNLESLINNEKSIARREREDEIIRLKEALKVAKSIGLANPPVLADDFRTEVSSSAMIGTLVYMRGSKALEAEIENLLKRASDDPFIENLRSKQEKLDFYRLFSVNEKSVNVFRQDGIVETPSSPVKPRSIIVLVLSLILGLVFGVFVATLKYFTSPIKA
ncbi:regulator of length of O-antigen component of lipopolysaccharide chains [Pseudomonas marincola]|uniref:O-antigen chain length regulator protein (Wzz) n=2 Tax=Pseudomonas marincola TaxID=437900 RepID=A0A653E729_9PSED|nr:regulator of length of O-antigen component of lipopolysaccharide chains [Pseudomonas marincola]